MLCLAAHFGPDCPKGISTTPNSNGLAGSEVRRIVEVGRCGIVIKTDTWTASIVDLSYPLALSCFLRLDVPEVISAARSSASGGPGVGRGGMSREGGYESEDCEAFGRSPISVLPSTVIVVGSEGVGPIHGWMEDVGIGGGWVLFGFLT